jgi:hypothetical protein
MDGKLQQAIVATRAGQKKKAQFLLTETLKENPEEVQAWFLLSHLVDSERKQIAYLEKAVDLDPGHDKARQRLAQLKTAETTVPEPVVEEEVPATEITAAPDILPVSEESMDVVTQEEGDTLPDWLADEAEHLHLDEITAEEQAEDALATSLKQADMPDVPDWVQEPVDEQWPAEEPASLEEELPPVEELETQPVPEAPATVAAEPPPDRQVQQSQETVLTRILIGLVVVAIIVFFVLLYVVFTTLL